MKRASNRCVGYHEDICLLASDFLPEQDRAEVERHLAACAGCQKYYDEMHTLAVPLLHWETNFAHIELDPALESRWAKAVHATRVPGRMCRTTREMFFDAGWRELLWPCPQAWVGLAAVWLVILALHFSTADKPTRVAKGIPRPLPEMIMALREQERLLAELIGSRGIPVAEKPKPLAPKPRSETAPQTSCV